MRVSSIRVHSRCGLQSPLGYQSRANNEVEVKIRTCERLARVAVIGRRVNLVFLNRRHPRVPLHLTYSRGFGSCVG